MNRYRQMLLPAVMLLSLPALAQDADRKQDQTGPQFTTTSTSTVSTQPGTAGDKAGAVRANTSGRERSESAAEIIERYKGYTEYSAAESRNTALVSEICTYSQYSYTYTCK